MGFIAISGFSAFEAEAQPVTPPPTTVAQPAPALVNTLMKLSWDSTLKETSPKPGQPTADFVFNVKNSSSEDIVIDHVQTSCGCTVAKLPSQPWTLTPGTNGQVNVTVNLAGKQGTFYKTVFVYATNGQKIDLNLKVNMPENPEMSRLRNQQLAMADHQSVFKGDCARCHVDPAKGLMGAPLYAKACGICHEAYPRDSKVTNLHAMAHPTNLDYWKQIIANGKTNTMMPGFSSTAGGPLTDDQIDSLVVYCYQNFTTAATSVKFPTQLTPTEPPPVPNSAARPPQAPFLSPARNPGVPLPPTVPSSIKH